jgi:hypothetical protein
MYLSNIIGIAFLLMLSEVSNNLPVYLEDKEKRKAHSKFLNRICSAPDTKLSYLSMLRLGEGLDPSVPTRSPNHEKIRFLDI